ncbi:uncharacterized protein LOC143464610 [Clavelina lepadiformis]|uniref:uncharacterized protein LOC143464610 n=1 Tax=Clavelina lepadiformis TaxID=159417 RepID=UPI00404357A3
MDDNFDNFADSDCIDSDMECELYSQIHHNCADNPPSEHSNTLFRKEIMRKVPNKHSSLTEGSHRSNQSFLAPHCTEKDSLAHVEMYEDFSDKEEWEIINSDAECNAETEINISIAANTNLSEKYKASDDCWKNIPKDRINNTGYVKRYFTPFKGRCKNCDESGHMAFECTKPKRLKPCYVCGQLLHQSHGCPNTVRCKRYGSDMICRRCGQKGHPKRECPDIWRQFHSTTKPGPLVTTRPNGKTKGIKYCFNCSKAGHYGHNCKKPRFHTSGFVFSPKVFKYDHWMYSKKSHYDEQDANISKTTPKQKKIAKLSRINSTDHHQSTHGRISSKLLKNGADSKQVKHQKSVSNGFVRKKFHKSKLMSNVAKVDKTQHSFDSKKPFPKNIAKTIQATSYGSKKEGFGKQKNKKKTSIKRKVTIF